MRRGGIKSAAKVVLAAGFAAVLAACHYQPKLEENGLPRPEDYKERIEDFVREQLADPTGIRNAFISEPALRPVGRSVVRFVVCFKFDGKDNSDSRRYAATKEFAAVFYDRRISQFNPATPELCGQAAYQPYVELQKLCREKKCAT